MTIRTLIVDDEDLARRGLRTLLRRADDVEILGECRNGREAIEAITQCEPGPCIPGHTDAWQDGLRSYC